MNVSIFIEFAFLTVFLHGQCFEAASTNSPGIARQREPTNCDPNLPENVCCGVSSNFPCLFFECLEEGDCDGTNSTCPSGATRDDNICSRRTRFVITLVTGIIVAIIGSCICACLGVYAYYIFFKPRKTDWNNPTADVMQAAPVNLNNANYPRAPSSQQATVN